MEKYSWNFKENEEIWSNDTHDTIEDCIDDAKVANREIYGNQYECVYIGENVPFVPVVDAESVLDSIEQQAADECGEVGCDWNAYDHKKQQELEELQEKLTTVVVDWMEKYGYSPEMYRIEGIQRYELEPNPEPPKEANHDKL